ncbi:hypothetical protein I302_107879 [Kwoniella bestiolae CBS 10118]|uniref:Transcriptional activator SPT8 n=1 Tax=Kwoniella bestiolae CBS 10118 TaxID=1296100 RepID=A0A1B9FX96_9TREE|nr:transcriptional activator SPT8 [Kwoniella bestiolae CBS 10118]OCF23398.1 transcriptional activator SPT8 [Kwoniella bestiolae CBS 10118]
MAAYDEDEEDEYYDNEEEEDDEGINGVNGEGDDDENDDGMGDGSDEDVSEADDDADDNEDEDEDDDDEGDNEEDEDAEENDDEEEDDEQNEDASTEDEAEGDREGQAEGEDGDIVMVGGDEEALSAKRSRSPSLKPVPEEDLPQPPHKIRRSFFIPSFTTSPKSLSIEAIVGIPLPSPVHSLASTSCLSYLLAGSQDGHVRAYDLWGSVNGGQMMTAQQRSVVGLGETINKAGVGRGWWANEVEGINGGSVGKRAEPVYSMACEGDGLFALTGTQSGPINLYTLRHAPGHLIHSLKGHTNVVSCLSLLPNEKGLLSGSWDGTVREWDLNTGQVVRTYPTHGAQLSSLSLRPYTLPASPTPSPRRQPDDEEDDGDITTKENISVSMGPDFFDNDKNKGDEDTDKKEKEDEQAAEDALPVDGDAESANVAESKPGQTEKTDNGNGGDDVEMSEAKSPSMDSLFGGDDDLDGEGETVPPSIIPSKAPTPLHDVTPTPPVQKPKGLGLALPGQPKPPPPLVSEQPTPATSSTGAAPLFVPSSAGPSSSRQAAAHIPLLSQTSYKAFSDDVLLTSSMDGQVVLIDRRVPPNEGTGVGVGRLMPGERAPPWCMSACWSANGTQVLAGRRNGTIDVWDVRRSSSASSPNLLRTLRTPAESGPISCLVAFPGGNHIATASQDNIRLWNTAEFFDQEENMRKKSSKPPFKIIAGHHGGTISSMIVDPTSRFLITASGDRGWQGESTKVVLIHEVKW